MSTTQAIIERINTGQYSTLLVGLVFAALIFCAPALRSEDLIIRSLAQHFDLRTR